MLLGKRITLTQLSAISLIIIGVISALARARAEGFTYGMSDFYYFYQSVLFYFSGQDIYSPLMVKLATGNYVKFLANVNPPFVMLLLLPVHIFNYANALFVWNIISIAAVLAGGYLALLPFPQWRKHRAVILLLLFISYPTVQSLGYGQLTGILMVVLALAWLFIREEKEIYAGLCIGFACAIKLFCGLFIVYLLCTRRFWAAGSAVFLILLSIMVSGMVFGFHSYVGFFVSLKYISWYAVGWNASLKGFLMRVFTSTENNIPLYDAPHLAQYLLWGLTTVVFLCLVGIWCKQGKSNVDRGFSLVLVGMLLLSPLSWIYYFPLLFIPYLVLVAEKNDWVHLAACFLLLLSMKLRKLVWPVDITTPVQIFWQGGIGFYVLMGMLILLARSYPVCERFSSRLWVIIYSLIFLPAVVGLVIYSIVSL